MVRFHQIIKAIRLLQFVLWIVVVIVIIQNYKLLFELIPLREQTGMPQTSERMFIKMKQNSKFEFI